MKFINNVFQSLLSLIRLIYYLRPPSPLKCIPKPSQEDCYVFGNGPSLKEALEHHLDFYIGKDISVVNHFVKSEYFEQIKPKYYLLIDPAFWSFDQMTPEGKQKVLSSYQLLVQKTIWPLYLFVHNNIYRSKLCKELLSENKFIKLIPINTTKIDGFPFLRHFIYRQNLGSPSPKTVLISSVLLAINLTYKNVYLNGVESSWTKNLRVRRDNVLCTVDDHFYDAEQGKEEDILIPLGSNMLDGFPLNLSALLQVWSDTFKSYDFLAIYARKRGTKIVNHSLTSFIDVFEKEDIKY